LFQSFVADLARRRHAVRRRLSRARAQGADSTRRRIGGVLRRPDAPRRDARHEPRCGFEGHRPSEPRARDPRGGWPPDRNRRVPTSQKRLTKFRLESFRDYLALEAGSSPHTVENYLRDVRRLGEWGEGRGVSGPDAVTTA